MWPTYIQTIILYLCLIDKTIVDKRQVFKALKTELMLCVYDSICKECSNIPSRIGWGEESERTIKINLSLLIKRHVNCYTYYYQTYYALWLLKPIVEVWLKEDKQSGVSALSACAFNAPTNTFFICNIKRKMKTV